MRKAYFMLSLVWLFLGFLNTASGQVDSLDIRKRQDSLLIKKTVDSISAISKNKNFLINEFKFTSAVDQNIYDRIHQLLKINNPSFYFSLYPSDNIISDIPESLALSDAEGAQGYFLELQLANRFNIVRMRPTRHKGFWNLIRWTIDFEFTYRVTREGENNDSPGLPLNTKVGTSIEYPFLLNNRSYLKKDNVEIQPKTFNTNHLNKALQMIVPKIQFMHYSNGQDAGALVYDSLGNFRNNYSSGNFSTNYLLFQLDYTRLYKSNALFNTFLGYRGDFGIGPAEFESTQEGRYGKKRIVGGIHVRTGPIIKKWVKKLPPNDYKFNESTIVPKERRKIIEFWARSRFEVIVDDTPLLTSNKWSFTTEFGLSPVAWRNTSFMIQWHCGRDYLNIRYDTVVNNVLLAAVFNFNKYRPSYVSTVP